MNKDKGFWHVAQRKNYVDEDTSDLGQLRPGKRIERPNPRRKNARHDAGSEHYGSPDPTVNIAVDGVDADAESDDVSSDESSAVSLLAIDEYSADNCSDLPSVIAVSRLQASRTLSVDDVINDRYVIVDNLPGSGMGQIYKALDRQRASIDGAATYVALKFSKPIASDNRSLSRIEIEFRKLSELHHHNVVRVFDIGTHNGAEFIVMEWLEGQSLLNVLEKLSSKRMALARAREIIQSTAAALAHAHARDVIHGDIKPSNIFVTRNDGVKLIDFGASSDSEDRESTENWTTEAYASAERLSGSPASKSDDVFALGVTAYLLLTGERPFGNSDAETARREKLLPEPLPADADENWPAVKAALSFAATERPGDAEQFLAKFRSEEEQTANAFWAEERTRRAVSVLPHIAAAVFLILVMAVWTTRPTPPGLPDVSEILRRADTALLQGGLIEPPQRSAFHYYRQALQRSPDSRQALDGLDEVASGLLARAGQSLMADDYRTARRNLLLATQVNPSHSGIPLVAELVGRHATNLIARADRVALSDPFAAEDLLRDAEQLAGRDNDEIASVREKMADALIEAELQLIFAGIDERILAERLAVPSGDSAIDLLADARRLRADDSRIPLAANRIVSALLFQALFAISEEKIGAAEAFINAAKTLDTRHLAMARAEYELVKAKNRIAAR